MTQGKESVNLISVIKSKFIDWSLSSTSHGYPNIWRTNRSLIRLIWILSFLGSTGFCFYLIVKIINSYLNYDFNTVIKIVQVEQAYILPALVFCNFELFATPSGTDYVLKSFRAGSKYGSRPNLSSLSDIFASETAQDVEIDMAKINVNAYFEDSTNHTSFGYTIDQMLIYCRYNLKKCESSDFQAYYDPIYGNCFRFNTEKGNEKNFKSLDRAGQTYGVNIEIFIGPPHLNQNQKIHYPTKRRGLRLLVFNQSNLPLSLDGIDLQVGTSTSIELKETYVSHLPPPYGSCQDMSTYSSRLYNLLKDNKKNYRQVNCLELCQQEYIINNCGCYDHQLNNLMMSNKPCVNGPDSKCKEDYTNQFNSDVELLIKCKVVSCPLECDSQRYDLVQSHASFPSTEYAEYLSVVPNSTIAKVFKQEGVALTYENIKESMLSLNLYLSSLEYTVISESETMSMLDLISNIGGLLGLFVGVSLLSGLELVELVLEILLTCLDFNKRTVLITGD